MEEFGPADFKDIPAASRGGLKPGAAMGTDKQPAPSHSGLQNIVTDIFCRGALRAPENLPIIDGATTGIATIFRKHQ